MPATGKKIFTTLVEYYINANGDKVYTGNSKPNQVGDPDYIAPIMGHPDCPIPRTAFISESMIFLNPTIWIGQESSAYCEDGNSFKRQWIGQESSAYCEVIYVDTNNQCIVNKEKLDFIVNVQDATEYNTNTGSLKINVLNGTEPFLFTINEVDFKNDGEFKYLPAGEYIVTCIDFLNKSLSKKVTIKQPPKSHNITYTLANGINYIEGNTKFLNNGKNEVDFSINLSYVNLSCSAVNDEILLEPKLLLVLHNEISFPKEIREIVGGNFIFEIHPNGAVWLIGGEGICKNLSTNLEEFFIEISANNLKYII